MIQARAAMDFDRANCGFAGDRDEGNCRKSSHIKRSKLKGLISFFLSSKWCGEFLRPHGAFKRAIE
jgi:hypothetical protein